MLQITPHDEGCVLPVRAQPGAKKTGVQGESAGALKVTVSAPPEDGKANLAIIEVLKDFLGLKRSQIELIKGTTNRNKSFLIRGLKVEELQEVLNQRLKEG